MLATKRFPALLAALAASMTTAAWAAPAATVDAVVAPAWLERNGRVRPLALGAEIRNGDRLRTGDGARIHLKLAEGSTVKLGANAGVGFFSRSLRPQRDFKGALDLRDGALRFSTDGKRRVRSRDVTIRVGAASATTGGADVWGRALPAEDVVALIDGKLELRHAALAEPIALAEPLSAVMLPKGGAPSVGKVAAGELAQWTRETEIAAGEGAQRRAGKWKLSLGRYGDQLSALEQYDLVRSAGYAPRIVAQADDTGALRYELVVVGFDDEREARRSAARLAAATGIAATPAR